MINQTKITCVNRPLGCFLCDVALGIWEPMLKTCMLQSHIMWISDSETLGDRKAVRDVNLS